MTPIPRIIHQTWKTRDVPRGIYDPRWIDSWTWYHPDWLYTLWTDDRLRELGRCRYPQFEILYGEGVPGIYLADLGRYMVLHQFGGLYVDLDYECLRSLEPLLDGQAFITSYTDESRQELNNALIAAVPAHPLLMRLMDACLDRWKKATRDRKVPLAGPSSITGPQMFTELTAQFLQDHHDPLKVYDAKMLCPIDWRKGLSIHHQTLTPEIIARVHEDYPDAYAVTYWTHAH